MLRVFVVKVGGAIVDVARGQAIAGLSPASLGSKPVVAHQKLASWDGEPVKVKCGGRFGLPVPDHPKTNVDVSG